MKFNSSRIFMHGVNWNLLPPAKLTAYVQNYPCIEHVARGKGSLWVEEGGGGSIHFWKLTFFYIYVHIEKKLWRKDHCMDFIKFFSYFTHTRARSTIHLALVKIFYISFLACQNFWKICRRFNTWVTIIYLLLLLKYRRRSRSLV